MLPIQSFDPSAFPNGSKISLNASDPGARILFYNESNNNIRLDFLNGNQDILHAWEARWWSLDGNTDEIDWIVDSRLSALAAPISLVMGTLYGPNEELPGTYPISLIRQTNVGNTINTVGGTANSIQNDTNAPGTLFIEATPSDAASSTVQLYNDGTGFFKVDVAGLLTEILQLIAGAHPGVRLNPNVSINTGLNSSIVLLVATNFTTQTGMTILGLPGQTADLLDLQNSSFVNVFSVGADGAVSMDTGKITTDGAGNLDVNGNLTVGTDLKLAHGSLSRVSIFTTTITTTPTNYPHGLGAVPDFVWVQPNGSTTTQRTCSVGSSDATNVQLTSTSGNSFGVTGMAIKL